MESFQDFFRDEVVWFLIGISLLILEFTAPGLILFFFGIGAILVSIVCMIFNPSINVELAIFILSSVILLFSLRKWLQRIFVGRSKEGEEMDDPLEEFAGHQAVVKKKLEPGKIGKVEFNGTLWKAISDEVIKPETLVEIVEIDNLTFTVKKI